MEGYACRPESISISTTGGVTTVVRQQTELLKSGGARGSPAVWQQAAGTVARPDSGGARALLMTPLKPGPPDGPYETAENILQAINRVWPGRQPDLIHVHNPTLAKNRCLQAVLKRLQQADLPLLCQVHDFAEDGRPEVYFEEPYIADCHYAVVNGRGPSHPDRLRLAGKGRSPSTQCYPPAEMVRRSACPRQWACALPGQGDSQKKTLERRSCFSIALFPETPLVITLPPHQRSGPSRLRHVATICGPPSSAGRI